MAKRQAREGVKRNEILAAALELFLEKGYEGTSIRMIQSRVGSEVGLFYYYFRSKDEVFEKAIDLFFESYTQMFAPLVERVWRDPFRVLSRFFAGVERITIEFREKFGDKVHWTVRWAIRERMLKFLEPYFKEIMNLLMEYGARPRLEEDVAVSFLIHGVGSAILHEESSFVTEKTWEFQRGMGLIIGLDPMVAGIFSPRYARSEDVSGCMELFQQTVLLFHKVPEWQFREQLEKQMDSNEALVIRKRNGTAGVVLFSRERKEVEFLAVRPDCQRNRVAARLMISLLSEFPVGTELSLITYRGNEPRGEASRNLFLRLGFVEGELLTKAGCPCQRFTIIVPERAPGGWWPQSDGLDWSTDVN